LTQPEHREPEQENRLIRLALMIVHGLVAVVVAGAVLNIILAGYAVPWTGFGETPIRDTFQPPKTLWDWFDLLIIPIVLLVGGFLLSRAERRRDQDLAEERRERDRELADARIYRDKIDAVRREQENALNTYLTQMTQLLVDKEIREDPRTSRSADAARDAARVWTLTTLRRVTSEQKRTVIQFLHDAGLIYRTKPIVNLSGADLRSVDLNGADLNGADLRSVDLNGADLSGAQLITADLSFSRLFDAHLYYTRLSYARLNGAYLNGAHLGDAQLIRADLSGADLSDANLFGAHLNGAHLINAHLFGADLSNAHLDGTDLRGANYNDATRWPDGFNPEDAGAIKKPD